MSIFLFPGLFQPEPTFGTLVHELIHQKQAEIAGQIGMFGFDPNERYEKLKEKYPTERTVDILKDPGFSRKVVRGIDLTQAVTEGIAIFGELYILNQAIKDAEQRNTPYDSNKLKTHRSFILGTLRDQKHYNPYATGAMKLVRGLYKKYGAENLIPLLEKIDLISCSRISIFDPKYEQILEDPSLLPGLEGVKK